MYKVSMCGIKIKKIRDCEGGKVNMEKRESGVRIAGGGGGGVIGHNNNRCSLALRLGHRN